MNMTRRTRFVTTLACLASLMLLGVGCKQEAKREAKQEAKQEAQTQPSLIPHFIHFVNC